MAQLLLGIPFIAEFLATITAEAAGVAEAAGLSAATSKALATIGTGIVAGAVTNEVNELVTNTIGRENVDAGKKTFDQLVSEAMGVISQDTSSFYSATRVHHADKKVLDLNKDNISKNINIHNSDLDPIRNITTNPARNDAIRPVVNTKEIADFAVNFASNVAKQGLSDSKIDFVQAMTDTINSNPTTNIKLAPIISTLFDGNLPKNELFNSISAVYNGAGMSIENNMFQFYDSQKKLIYFKLIDELKKEVILYQTTGIIVPAVHGIFYGPRSANNALPVDLVDFFAAFHDSDYSNGPNLTGDYKFISRLANQYPRMNDDEKKWARIGILYFGTLGTMISTLVGNNSTDVHEVVNDTPVTNDIFTSMNEGQQPNEPILHYTNRTKFYQELYKDIENASVSSSIIAQNGNFQKELLFNEFESILVEII